MCGDQNENQPIIEFQAQFSGLDSQDSFPFLWNMIYIFW